MNPSEQRSHRTVTSSLAKGIEEVANASGERMTLLEERIGAAERRCATLAESINAERTHRLKLADEQRYYVDRGDKTVDLMIRGLRDRGFFGRLKWLLRGR